MVFSRVFTTRGPTNTVNTDVFDRSEAQHHGMYDDFPSGSKKHGIYNVFWPAPSTNTGIYGGFTM